MGVGNDCEASITLSYISTNDRPKSNSLCSISGNKRVGGKYQFRFPDFPRKSGIKHFHNDF